VNFVSVIAYYMWKYACTNSRDVLSMEFMKTTHSWGTIAVCRLEHESADQLSADQLSVKCGTGDAG
jgi:hypothetical protein